MRLFILFSCFFLLLPISYANGVGNPVEQQVANYTFEFGIDPRQPLAGEHVVMSFAIQQENSSVLSHYYVRIAKQDSIMFATTDLEPNEEGIAYMSFAFPKAGDYEILVSALDKQKPQTMFIVHVRPSNYFSKSFIASGVMGIAIGFIIAFLILRKPKNRNIYK